MGRLHSVSRILRGPPTVRPWVGHLVAVGAAIGALGIQHALVPWVTLVPFILFFLAVFVSAWIGGRGPGFTSMLASALVANHHFLPPIDALSASAPALLLTGLFLLVSLVVVLLCGSLRDAIRAAERTAALLRAVQDQMPAGVVVADASGKVLTRNEEKHRIFRQPWRAAETIAEYSAWKGFHPDGRPYAPEEWPLARSIERGEAVRGEEIEIVRGDGTRGFVSVSSAPVRDSHGQLVAGVAVDLDVTERKRAEEALREADRKKDEFLAVLSHELRNPLAPVQNSLFILEHAPPGGEQAVRAREVIARQVAHLTRLVDDLLDVTRVARGKIRLQLERADLVGLTRRTVEDYRSAFARAHVELALDLPGAPMCMFADPTRIAQAIGNVLGNALKFTPRGGRVALALLREDGHGVIRVTDSGAGMSEELLARLFVPFAQADRTLDRSKGGLGLGLALVKALAEMHGGSVTAKSEGIGRGSELVIRLPVDDALGAIDRAPLAAPVPERRRIVLVEDNVDAAESLADMLRLRGHEVAVAHDGREGLERVRELHPDVVLCDIGLPGLDGYELARAVRADESLEPVCLIAVTGYALPDDIAKAKAAGFDRHLAKPPALDRLEQVLAGGAAA